MQRVKAWTFSVVAVLSLVACQSTTAPKGPTGLCSDISCKPPPCCGQAVGADGGCCVGTLPGADGTCVPPSCAACGGAGCTVDAARCTATCTRPTCCLAACAGPADCCPGTACQANAAGEKKCFPTGCDACTGWKTVCRTSTTACTAGCDVITTCGQACTDSTTCGTGGACRAMASGAKQCVPSAYDTECAKCPGGCAFDAAKCELTCVVKGDGGVDAGLETQPPDALVTCEACCAPCEVDAGTPCCAGNVCVRVDGGPGQCLPAACSGCAHGCDYACPAVR